MAKMVETSAMELTAFGVKMVGSSSSSSSSSASGALALPLVAILKGGAMTRRRGGNARVFYYICILFFGFAPRGGVDFHEHRGVAQKQERGQTLHRGSNFFT
jgi:hypothetical protein